MWIIESGCTHHMSSNIKWFTNLRDLSEGSVLIGSNQRCEIEGVGSVKVRQYNGKITTLSYVRLVPKLRRNLIFISMK